jgi:hypothetical protein
MPSPPRQQRQSISNKFRAEPFVNQFAAAAHSGDVTHIGPVRVSEGLDGGDRESAMAMANDEDELYDGSQSQSQSRIRDPHRRVSLANSSFSHAHGAGPPSISDIQRASIASSASTSSSITRRSSYDPNEPGILEKIHTGQGKSKRKPIAVQQWTMMNTFKIRPAAGVEVVPPIPLSVAPDRPLPISHSPVEDEANLVFVAERAIQHSPPVPRAIPIVIPPTTLQPPSIPAPAPRSPRKRPRYVCI